MNEKNNNDIKIIKHKVEDKIIDELLKLKSEYNNIVIYLGQINVEKILIEESLKELKEKEDNLLKQIRELREKEKSIVDDLVDKYGNGNLDLQKREYIVITSNNLND